MIGSIVCGCDAELARLRGGGSCWSLLRLVDVAPYDEIPPAVFCKSAAYMSGAPSMISGSPVSNCWSDFCEGGGIRKTEEGDP